MVVPLYIRNKSQCVYRTHTCVMARGRNRWQKTVGTSLIFWGWGEGGGVGGRVDIYAATEYINEFAQAMQSSRASKRLL
jgi:hypothetical protein